MVSADVTNTGKSAGKEVVQLYIRDLTGSAIRPEKELKALKRFSWSQVRQKQLRWN